MTKVLREMCPEEALAIEERGARLDSVIASVDREVTALLGTTSGMAFLVMHPSMSYFARDYGLRQIALEQEGKEPSPRQLATRIAESRRAGADVMITDPSKGSRTTADLARQAGVRCYQADFNAADFIEQYRQVAKRLTEQE